MSKHGVEGDELTEKWRNRVTDAVGAAEGLRGYCDQFINEAQQVLKDWGNPFPFGTEMAHFSDYRQTVNEIIGHLADSMKIYREYVEIFGDESLIRCDCCNLFKSDCADYPSKDGEDSMFLCMGCAHGQEEVTP
jgi:hypothetical protein